MSVADILYPDEKPLQRLNIQSDSMQPLAVQLAKFEAEVIKQALRAHQGNIKAVMLELDLPRRTLNQKMAKHGITRADYMDDSVGSL